MDEYQIISRFMEALPSKPIYSSLIGSRGSGQAREDSDWDILALYEHNNDIPYEWIWKESQDGLVWGEIDFHYFARDWRIFQLRPTLWDQLISWCKKI